MIKEKLLQENFQYSKLESRMQNQESRQKNKYDSYIRKNSYFVDNSN